MANKYVDCPLKLWQASACCVPGGQLVYVLFHCLPRYRALLVHIRVTYPRCSCKEYHGEHARRATNVCARTVLRK